MFKQTAFSFLRVAHALLYSWLLLSACVYASVARAQLGTGSLTGVVSDASNGRTVADAVVTATSPNVQLEQLVLSDSTGHKAHSINLGAGYQARSGAPTNYLGQHRLYGRGEVFLLPRGSGERLPWTHNIDVHFAYQFAQTKSQNFAVTVDVFNLFNFQQVIEVNESYTYRSVEPITGDAAKRPYVDGNRKNLDPARVLASDVDANPRAFDDTDKNRAFGAPVRYQAPFTLRLGIKSTF